MKKSLHHLLVLLAALVCFGTFTSLIEVNPAKDVVATTETGEALDREYSIKAADWYVSSAENRLSSHNGPVYKTDEDYTKRKKQKLILAIFSQIKFSLAKVYSLNESLSTKRQPAFDSIITANRQLRL